MPAPVNVYVCSTVRHLLFALLRATKHAGETHELIFFSDYQGVDLDKWRLDNLSAGVRIHGVTQQGLRQHLKATAGGRLIYFIAMRNLAVPAAFAGPIHRWLSEYTSVDPGVFDTGVKLWLFNERNKMARVLRLLVRQFALIEDGEGNYQQLHSPWWRWLPRMLLGRPLTYRVFGEDRRCTEIWALHPERLPEAVRHKGRPIDFVAGERARDLIRSLFATDIAPVIDGSQVILATQPIDCLPDVTLAQKQDVYAQIAKHLAALGYSVLLKVHPVEDEADYAPLAGLARMAPGKVPLEALILEAETRIPVISIMSSAGMGFEQYCRRIQLSPLAYTREVPAWAANRRDLQTVLDQQLTAAALC